MKVAVDEWRAAGPVLSSLLLYAFLNPLVTAFTPLPDLSGTEAVLVIFAWMCAIVGSGRLHAIDAVVPALFVWSLISAAVNQVTPVSAALIAALLSCPFVAAKIIICADDKSLVTIRRVLVFLVLAQVGMFGLQLITYSGIDDLVGTFVKTQYGAHIAAFIVLLGATAYALSGPRGWRGPVAIGVAVVLALLADAKTALVYFLGISTAYIMIGKPLRRVQFDLRLATRGLGGLLGALTMWIVYTGVLGTVALSSYIDQSTATGGGKIAVAPIILNPTSYLWQQENMLIGAGPAQTVSRTAGFTVPARLTPIPPGERLGMEPAQYHIAMQNEARGSGHVGRSSATSAASSVLGIIGDLGVIGAAIYAWGYWWVYRQIALRSSWRSWPALAWLGLLFPGFLGEWLEFPPAMMGAVTILMLMAMSSNARSQPPADTAEVKASNHRENFLPQRIRW